MNHTVLYYYLTSKARIKPKTQYLERTSSHLVRISHYQLATQYESLHNASDYYVPYSIPAVGLGCFVSVSSSVISMYWIWIKEAMAGTWICDQTCMPNQ